MEDLTGRQFGPYRIVEPLGEGGMAAVFKAYQASMDRYVAIKVLPSHLAKDPSFVGRFHQEARVLAKLQHPHILPVHDFGECEGYTYIVMPFVETGTLADLLHQAPLPLKQIQRILSRVGEALDYAHGQGVVHRDVKPSNILVDQMGNCLLTDFGIAKMVEGTAHYTQTGGIVGTPDYMSPEQIRGETLDGRSDIYSLGIVLYELATGRAPFQAETPAAILVKHLLDPLPPPRTFNPDLSEGVQRVILKSLAKERDDRYQTAGEMAAAFAEAVPPIVDRVPAEAPPTVVDAHPARGRRRPAWAMGLIGVLVLVGLAAVAYSLSPRDRPRALPEGVPTASLAAGPTEPTAEPAATPALTPSPMPLIETLAQPLPQNALYRRDLATPIGNPIQWPQTAPDPRTLDPVGYLGIKGYALGERTAEIGLQLQVPPEADLISIPLATALNGAVDETDSEAGVIITVSDPGTGQTATTFATHIMETTLDEPYLYAYADASPFRGRQVTLKVTLLHPDVCSGSLCTHDIDLYLGPVQFERLPDLCTQEADGSHLLYDYPDDPSPTQIPACTYSQPVYFVEASANAAQPFRNYGAGQDSYQLHVQLPQDYTLLTFALQYGPRVESMSINGVEISPKTVYQAFPVRPGTFNRVEESARYSFANNNPAAVASYFSAGANAVVVVVAADQSWEERPFSLYARFLARGASD